ILIYDPVDQSLTTPFPTDSVLQLKVSNYNSVLYCDRDGITWCGLWIPNGIYQIIPFSPAVKLIVPDPTELNPMGRNSVINFSNAGPGKVGVNAMAEVYLYDKNASQIYKSGQKPGFEFSGKKYRP